MRFTGMIQRLYEMAKRQQSNSEESEKRETQGGGANSNVDDEGIEESGSVVEFGENSEDEDGQQEVCALSPFLLPLFPPALLLLHFPPLVLICSNLFFSADIGSAG